MRPPAFACRQFTGQEARFAGAWGKFADLPLLSTAFPQPNVRKSLPWRPGAGLRLSDEAAIKINCLPADGGGGSGGNRPPVQRRLGPEEFREALTHRMVVVKRNLIIVAIFSFVINVLVLAQEPMVSSGHLMSAKL